MMPAIEGLNRSAEAWVWLAWAVTWQSAVLVVLFAIVGAVLRRSSPGLRYGLWQVAAIKLLVMPLWTVAILLPSVPRSVADAGRGPVTTERQAGGSTERPSSDLMAIGRGLPADGTTPGPNSRWTRLSAVDWTVWLMLGWGLGIVVQLAAILRQRDRLNGLLRRSTPADDLVLLDLVTELSRQIGLRHPPVVVFVDVAGSPFVCGLRRPLLVLPQRLDQSLESGALRAVLLHELTHLRRHDLIWDWIPTIARLVYWFHPAAHFIADRARLERELACDQAAMVLAGQDAASYASILVEVVSRTSVPLARVGTTSSTPLRRLSS